MVPFSSLVTEEMANSFHLEEIVILARSLKTYLEGWEQKALEERLLTLRWEAIWEDLIASVWENSMILTWDLSKMVERDKEILSDYFSNLYWI